MNSKATTTFFSLALVAIIGLLWGAYFYFTLSPVMSVESVEASASANNPIIISKGDGLKKIADMLEEKNLIRSASSFEFYSFLTGKAHQLKPGLYNLNPASSTIEIIRLLAAGPGSEVQVLITEGQSMYEIDATLAKLGVIKPNDLVKFNVATLQDQYPFLLGSKSLEGFLFPDTYRFFFGSTPEEAVRPFLENFKSKVEPLIASETTVDYDNIPITRRGIYSIKDIVTIASLLEKEVPSTTDRQMVADIIYRRLKIRMALQIDATVDYAKLHGSQFNTYENPGLPPTPIANPGIDALTAALNPKANQYLFYLSDPKTKKTIFSKTFDEHKINKEQYLR